MDLIENWINIFERHDEVAIFPFLKGLTTTQKKDLLPLISKTAKSYLELKDRLINGKHFYTKKASRKQERILNYSIFVTVPNRKHNSCKWLNVQVIATPIVSDKILPWYCPSWFSDYLNELAQLDFRSLPMTYELVMEMAQKNYMQPSELLIAKLLTRLIYPESPNQRWVYQFRSENLKVKACTLEKHFWYLFEQDTQIYNCERQLPLTEDFPSANNNWYVAIKKYVDAGTIDRTRLLKACLSACNKPIFNKLAIGWFMGLFDFIRPTKRELLAIQTELFQTYTLPYSKATNTALKGIQKIASLPDFQVDHSLINFDKLLISKTKSIVLNGLSILEKIAINHKEKLPLLCELASQSFSTRDATIQHKAATFIQQYGDKDSSKLKTLILSHKTNLLYATKTILGDIIGDKKTCFFEKIIDSPALKKQAVKLLKKQTKIPLINGFDEFVHLALQIFDNNEPYHFDQFIANLLVFQKEIKGENIGRLLPLFRRAYQLVFNELPSNHGMLDNMLATFLLDYSDLLIGRFPADSKDLQKLAKSYLEQGFYINDQSIPFDLNYTHLNRWYNPFDPSQVYAPLKLLLEQVLINLQQQKIQTLLSTPTHHPSWLNPLTFVERLIFYQENNLLPPSIDLQIAISRIAFEQQTQALKLANEKLKGHFLALAKYILSTNSDLELQEESEKYTPQQYELLVAAITKNSVVSPKKIATLPTLELPSVLFTGNHKWMVFWEERQFEYWNHKTQKLEFADTSFIHRELQVKTPKDINFNAHPNFLYQYFPGSAEAFRPNTNDVKRLLGLVPNNPSPLIALLVADNLKYATFWEILAKKRAVEMIDWLANQHHLNYTPPIHLLLATTMLCEDKKMRLKAGKIWQNAVTQNQLNPSELGLILGRLENKELAPLKRFTNLVQNHLLNISEHHNKALEKTIAHLLAKLPPIPIKHTKQLLLLYHELLASNESTINNKRLLILLRLWQDSPSLKKILKKLRAFNRHNSE